MVRFREFSFATVPSLRSGVRLVVAAVVLVCAKPALASSCDELVRLARAHEASSEPEAALRQYHEAVTLDATCGPAWLGLGSLRARMGDPAEAERVFDAAMTHVASLDQAALGRARARWSLGRHEEAESDMQRYIELAVIGNVPGALGALEELAGWYRAIARAPAELACWRRIAALAPGVDAALATRARALSAALEIVVGDADPVRHPPRADLLRRVAAGRRR